MIARSCKGLAVCVLAVALVVLASVGQASAALPWWHVSTESVTAATSGGESGMVVEVSNLGDAMANGLTEHIVVVDQLPAGVTPSQVYGEGGGGDIGKAARNFSSCSIAGQTVTCTYSGPVLTYERMMIDMTVKVAAGAGKGVNDVSVSGGGVAPIVSRKPLQFSDSKPSFGAQSYELTPEEEGGAPDTQAGSHPFQLTTTLLFNTVGLHVERPGYGVDFVEAQPLAMTKDLRFSLPPGLIGNPTPLPKCDLSTFLSRACPDTTVVGVATPIVLNPDVSARVPLAETTALYNLEPSVGEPARFGFQTAVGPVILDTSVRTGGDYGVVVTVPDILEVGFIGTQVTFWGVPADPRHDVSRNTECLDKYGERVEGEGFEWELKCSVSEKPQPFLIMPTSCEAPWATTVEGDSWTNIGKYTEPFGYTFSGPRGEPLSEDGCNKLNFGPSASLAPDGQEGATPTGLTVGIHVPQEASLNPAGLANAAVKDTTVALPTGVVINPGGADGLEACSTTQVGLESASEQSCPEASKIGTVEIETPLLPHRLEGAAYLAQQYANPFGSLVAMYLVVKDPVSGVIVKLAGQVTPDPVTGQLVSTFNETPELPFENLRLHFFGGSRAPLGTPSLCGSYTTTASIVPWSGTPPVNSSSKFEITSGPNHTACSDPLPFNPELTTGSLNIQAGAFTPFTMTMSREDGNQNLDAIKLVMPPGLLGELSKTKLCGEAEGNAGTCGPESLIGETTVSVGLGGNPYTVKGGRVYITGPYAGAPYGLSIVNPAKAGPFDLGQVVVRAKIEVDPSTAAITITSDTTGPYRIPQIIDGIPLQIKHVNVTINRPEFTFNPTNCQPQQIGGALTSSEGAVSTLHVPFQVTNCAVLGFKPIFSVSTNGKTSRAKGASLTVKLTYPKAAFRVPRRTSGPSRWTCRSNCLSRLTTFRRRAPAANSNANPLDARQTSIVGHATAITPILPVPIQGPAYFVSYGGAKFPEL